MVRCKKCGKEIKDKNWPVENTGGMCEDCAYDDFREKGFGETKKDDKKEEKKNIAHEKQMIFEKELAVFLGEFEAYAQIADDEDRFLTPEELRVWEQRLKRIWEEHIKNTGQEEWLESFKRCFNCQNRKTSTEPLMTLGVIRCENRECKQHRDFSKMFNQIYAKRDVDRAKRHVDELLRTPEDFEPGKEGISGETMMRTTKLKERDRESRNVMYV